MDSEKKPRKLGRKRSFEGDVERVSGYIPKPTARLFKAYLYKQDRFETLAELVNDAVEQYLKDKGEME